MSKDFCYLQYFFFIFIRLARAQAQALSFHTIPHPIICAEKPSIHFGRRDEDVPTPPPQFTWYRRHISHPKIHNPPDVV